MYSTQTKGKWNSNRNKQNSNLTSYQLPLPQDEQIHHYPQNIRRSIKLQQHRLRPTLNRKNKYEKYNREEQQKMVKNIDRELATNLNLTNFLNQNKLVVTNDNHLSFKLPEQFQTTADRMSSMRKKLSPVKNKQKEEKRFVHSVDKMRDMTPVQRNTFLNIEKAPLIHMYNQDGVPHTQAFINRKVESATDRYLYSPNPSPSNTPQLNFKKRSQLEQAGELVSQTRRQIKESRKASQFQQADMMVELKRALKEPSLMGTTPKWHTNKPRTKNFVTPFERYQYKDFIWKIALSNGILHTPILEETKLKVYIGKGNNSQLVRSLIKRRSWWSFTDKYDEANFVWTQLKVNPYFNLQSSSSKQETVRKQIPKDVLTRNKHILPILNEQDVLTWDNYWRQYRAIESKMNEDMSKRNYFFRKQELTVINPKNVRIHNHMSQNFIIGNKKALLYTMREYYENCGENVFDYLPLSFHINKGVNDDQFSRFLSHYYERRKKSKKDGTNNVWIVKPGELTNRGNGIIVCLTLDQIKGILKKGGRHFDGSPKTFIVQEYIERPLLYQKRKFDLRHFLLVTSVNGHFKGYWYKKGFIRTSSFEYTLIHGQSNVHLTNDAVQKWLPDYGKYQKGNKISYQDFQHYLLKQYSGKINFFSQIYPKMKKMAIDAIKASARTLDPKHREHCFELFGLDFMIDQDFHPWLIQCNSNPCLEISCPLLTGIIPNMIQNILRISVDSLVGPPADFAEKRPRFTDNALNSNDFEMVYDSVLEENDLRGAGTLCGKLNVADLDREEDQEFQDDGQALQD